MLEEDHLSEFLPSINDDSLEENTIHLPNRDSVSHDRTVTIASPSSGHIIITGDDNKVVINPGNLSERKSPFQARPSQVHYVHRQRISTSIKSRLLEPDSGSPGYLETTVIHGFGGVGKTSVMRALAHDLEVRNKFSDGILWHELGQEPDLLALLRGWLYALGDIQYQSTTVQAASIRLSELLYEKKTLLILDNAWQYEHVEPFQIGGSKCHLVITTRFEKIAERIGATAICVDPMNMSESLKLMAHWTGEIANKDKSTAIELAKRFGYLPLALELIGPLVKKGGGWSEFARYLEEKNVRLPDVSNHQFSEIEEKVKISIELSVNELTKEEQDCYLQLVVFPKGVPFSAKAAANLWNENKVKTLSLLENFASWNLLSKQEISSSPHYFLHDLLYSYAIDRLGKEQLIDLHTRLLKSYKVSIDNKPWHELKKEDHYIYDFLVWHLEQAGQFDEIHNLLCEQTSEGWNGWYQSREQLGQIGGYLNDVSRAWQLAEDSYAKTKDPVFIGYQIRYALIITSLNSLAKKIPPNLLLALIESGYWPVGQGIAYARQVPNREQKSRALLNLAVNLGQSGNSEKAVRLVKEIEVEKYLAEAIVKIVPYLKINSNQVAELVSIVKDIKFEEYQSKAIVEIAPFLSGDLLSKVYKLAVVIKIKKYRLEALTALAPLLDEALEQALEILNEIDDNPRDQIKVLLSLASCIKEKSSQKLLLSYALEIIDKVNSELEQAYIIRLAAPGFIEFDTDLSQQLVNRAIKLVDIRVRNDLLTDLAMYLPEVFLHQLIEIDHTSKSVQKKTKLQESLTFDYEYERWRIFAIARLGNGQKALNLAQKIKERNQRLHTKTLIELAPFLPTELKEKVQLATFGIVRSIDSRYFRATTLAELASQMRTSYKRRVMQAAFETAKGINDYDIQLKALFELLSHCTSESNDLLDLGQDIVKQTRLIIQEIKDGQIRGEALDDIVSWLIKYGHHQEALSIVRSINDYEYQKDTLLCYAEQLLNFGNPKAALAALGKISWKDLDREFVVDWKTLILECELSNKFTIYMNPTEGDQASKTQPVTYATSDSLTDLAFRLVKIDHPREALLVALAMEDTERKIRTLVDLLQLIPIEVRKDALVVIWHQVNTLKGKGRLFPNLPETLRREAQSAVWEKTKKIENSQLKAKQMEEIADSLPLSEQEKAFTEVWNVIRTIDPGWTRANKLVDIAARFQPGKQKSILAEAIKVADGIEDDWARAETLAQIAIPIAKLGYANLAVEVATKIVGEWALWTQVQALIDLVPHLSHPVRDNVLLTILMKVEKVRVEGHIASTISHLASYLHGESLEKALKIVLELDFERHQSRAIIELAPYCSSQEQYNELLAVVFQMKDEYHKAATLSSLCRFVSKTSQTTILSVVKDMTMVSNQEIVLASICEYLYEENIAEALKIIQKITDEENRFPALSAMANRLNKFSREQLSHLWVQQEPFTEILHVLASRTRHHFLKDLVALTPVLKTLGGEVIFIEVTRTIQNMGRWWP